MRIHPRYLQLRDLADRAGIHPSRCWRCKNDNSGWKIGEDDGRDPDYVGWQCQRCGAANGLSRGAIRARIRRAADKQ
jgi:hypothetical protein